MCWPLLAYVGHFVFLRDVWILSQWSAVASRRAPILATHLVTHTVLWCSQNPPFCSSTLLSNLIWRWGKETWFAHLTMRGNNMVYSPLNAGKKHGCSSHNEGKKHGFTSRWGETTWFAHLSMRGRNMVCSPHDEGKKRGLLTSHWRELTLLCSPHNEEDKWLLTSRWGEETLYCSPHNEGGGTWFAHLTMRGRNIVLLTYLTAFSCRTLHTSAIRDLKRFSYWTWIQQGKWPGDYKMHRS